MTARPAPILVDHSHCGRHVTGLERITLELFSAQALAPLPVVEIRSGGAAGMIAAQALGLPARALMHRKSLVLCPGFPPSPLLLLAAGHRVIPYIHDLFLITRWNDLNIRAKLYMAAPFRLAVARLPRFLVNSESTAAALRGFCRRDAEITLYRPRVRNAFGLEPGNRELRVGAASPLKLVAIGTVEPRKNLRAAAAIVQALQANGFPGAKLDIVGRTGWGPDAAALAAMPGVTLHGYQTPAAARAVIDAADLLISTSHDEGLGLPLIEAQYAGLAVAAPGQPVFREVLGGSGIFIDPAQPAEAAARIAAAVAQPGWRRAHASGAARNIARWNSLAETDHAAVLTMLAALARDLAGDRA